MRAHQLALAVSPDARLAGWHGSDGGSSAIFIQALDAAGQTAGKAITVSDGTAFACEPDIIPVDDQAAVAGYLRHAETGHLAPCP